MDELIELAAATRKGEGIERLLRERARQMAKAAEERRDEVVAASAEDLYLVLALGNERFGFPLSYVSEVVPLRAVMAIPGVPPHVTGLVRSRGRVLALVDLRTYLHGTVRGHLDSDTAVVLNVEGIEFGVECTEIEGLVHLPADEIAELPANLSSRLASSLRGLALRDLLLLKPEALIHQPGFLVRQRSQ